MTRHASRFSLTRGTVAALTLLGLAALAPTAQAQTTVYNNGTFGTANALTITDLTLADDFVLASPTSFDAIRFWAMDGNPGLLGDFSGDLTWFIYSGSAGSPSPNAIPSTTIVSQGTVSGGAITITDTGSVLLGDPDFEIAQLDFSIPTQNLAAGTYWLRLKEGTAISTSDGTDVSWVDTGAANTGNGFRSDDNEVTPTTWNFNTTSTTVDLAFQLRSSSAAAPEPGTLALLALGVVGGLIARRRK
ncbi:PEP-CTERM sorting domain-containing protein [Armatimonas sp.]|uniref:PEP-CTERM sorting domain-containing protein n=1 Tax=Armatimonas sp. TaxID=1872638 RepID=UPI00286CA57F|nr:PEP-CTERM sorting domain-containing protein [Armatimonas sp.]